MTAPELPKTPVAHVGEDATTAVVAAVRAVLAEHANLPHVVFDRDHVAITEPVRIGDVTELARALGADHLLPEALPVDDVVVTELSLGRHPLTAAPDVQLAIAFHGVAIDIADGVRFEPDTAEFHLRQGSWRASGDGILRVHGIVLTAHLELPSLVMSAVAATDRGDVQPALPPGIGALGPIRDRSGPTVDEVRLFVAPPVKFAAVHVAASNLATAGPLHLARAEVDLVVSGRNASRDSAQAVLDVTLDLGTHDAIELQVDGLVTAEGWRAVGEVTTDGMTLARLVAGLGGATDQLPSLLRTLSVDHLRVEVDTIESVQRVATAVSLNDDVHVTIEAEHRPDGLSLDGVVHVSGLVFRLHLDQGAGDVLTASLESAAAHPVHLDELLGAFVDDHSATGVDLEVIDVLLAVGHEEAVLLVAEVDAGFDLSALGDLPVLGDLLPPGATVRLALTPLYVRGTWTSEILATVARAAPGRLVLPEIGDDETLATGTSLSGQLFVGDVPLGPALLPAPPTGEHVLAPATPPSASPTQAVAPSSEVEWVEVDRTLGPIQLGRVGYHLDDPRLPNRVELEVDASITFGGIGLGLDGLGVAYVLDTGELTPRLRGMSLDVDVAPITVAGGFANNDGDFAGKIQVGTPQFALTAIGAFTMLDNTPSVFVYGVLDMPIGGPVFFFVEGLAAGFGVHRQLHLPSVEQIHAFPLVADAVAASQGTGTPPTDATSELARISQYVSPRLGEHFFAVGVKFSSFKLLESFALLVVSIGEQVEIDLVGLSTLQVPSTPAPGVPALVRVEIDLVARIELTEGLVDVSAVVAPGSYVYSPLCQLSGGAAFRTWFAGPHAGDFVLTIGGYNRKAFDKPDHYPNARRIELRYQVSSAICLKGQAYFALTPSAVMAGGGLHAQVILGALHAHANLTVDFLMAWEPYHYDARIHIDISASWHAFHTEATADLMIWGPSFSGSGSVDWWIFSFDVTWGSGLPFPAFPLTWRAFADAFLPAAGLVSARITAGLVESVDVGDDDGPRVQNVTPVEVRIAVESAMPLTAGGLRGERGLADLDAPDLGVFPMQRHDLGDVELEVTAHRGTDPTAPRHDLDFVADPVRKAFPAAMWSPRTRVAVNDPPLQAVGGFVIRAALPPQDIGTDARDRADVDDDHDWAFPLGPSGDPTWYGYEPVEAIAVTADGEDVRPEPDDLPLQALAAVGLDTTGIGASPGSTHHRPGVGTGRFAPVVTA